MNHTGGWIVVGLCIAWMCVSSVCALKLSESPINQENIQILLRTVDVRVRAHTRYDGGLASYCESSPQLHHVIDNAYMGTPSYATTFVVRTDTSVLVPVGRPWSVSQTYETDGTTCSARGREIVYIGNGMFWHMIVSHTQRPALPRTGQLGLGFDETGGTWTTPNGWATVNMFFGHEHSFGWIVLNTTGHHPYADPHQLVEAPARVAVSRSGTMIIPNASLRMQLPDGSHETMSVTLEFLPEYRFMDIPPILFQRFVDRADVRAHDTEAVNRLPRFSLHADAPGLNSVPIVHDTMVLTHKLESTDLPQKFLALRKGSQHNVVRVGCAMTSVSVYWNGRSFEPASDNVDTHIMGTVQASFARVSHVEQATLFNTYAFLVLSLSLMAWIISTTATSMRVRTTPVDEWRAQVAFVSEFSWWKEGMETVCAVTSIVVVWINVEYLHLYERFIHFVGWFHSPWNLWFVRLLFWIVVTHGSTLLLMLAVELMPWFNPRQRPSRSSSPSRARPAVNSGILIISMAQGNVKHTVLGHVQVWYFYIMIRQTMFLVSVFLAMTITRMEGPPSGDELLVVIVVAFIMILLQSSKVVELVRALLSEWITRGIPCHNIGNELQVVFFLTNNIVVLWFDVVFFLAPTISNVMWDINWVSDWVVTILAIVWIVCSAIGFTANAISKQGKRVH